MQKARSSPPLNVQLCRLPPPIRWSRSGSNNGGEEERETTFRARVDLEDAAPGGVNFQVGESGLHEGGGDGGAVFVVAVTTVDQAWGSQLEKGWPDVGPQVCYTRQAFGCCDTFVPHELCGSSAPSSLSLETSAGRFHVGSSSVGVHAPTVHAGPPLRSLLTARPMYVLFNTRPPPVSKGAVCFTD